MPARKPLSDALETVTPAANRIDRLLFNGAPFIKKVYISICFKTRANSFAKTGFRKSFLRLAFQNGSFVPA